MKILIEVVCIIALFTAGLFIGYLKSESLLNKKGKDISKWLTTTYGYDIPPEVAQHINIVFTTTDVQLSIDQFTVFEDGEKR